jgi:hypothetical protein
MNDMAGRNAWIVSEYQVNLRTMQDIGDDVGISRERVRQILEENGIKGRSAGERPVERVAYACAVCGEVCEVYPSVAKTAKCCSIECRGCLTRKWSRCELIDHMVFLARELGRTPGAKDIDGNGPPYTGTYQHHFGSLRKAQVAAGLTPRKRGRPSKNRRDT